MKKIIILALILGGLSQVNASAQDSKSTVCNMNAKKGSSCYTTRYAENFKVCKNNGGYVICGQQPNKYNSTHPGYVAAPEQNYAVNNVRDRSMDENVVLSDNNTSMMPQSQSYQYIGADSYEGYYPKVHYIKVSYDNVADENRAPYEGLPSPQYDGPDRNKERNINANSPVNLAPNSGRPTE